MDLKIENIVRNASNKPYLTKFLTIAEQADLQKYNKNYQITFSDNYPDEERKRAFVSTREMSITPDFKISFLKINSKIKLRHPDILGAILSLGLERDVLGDILVDEQIIFCTDEVANFIINNLKMINRVNIEMEIITNFNYSGNNNYEEKQIIVSSLRLDGILAKSLNLSRSKAQELVDNRLIKINGNIELKCDYNCIESDIVSVTRVGRIKILDVTRKTKKDKLVLNILITKI